MIKQSVAKGPILCTIGTRGRYDSTLAMTIQSVITQIKKPDHLIIFDDNDEPNDIREMQTYRYLLHMLELSGITWQVIFGEKKGTHHNHQKANLWGFPWVWRLDDDTVAEPNVLANLCEHISDDLGAVGGSILTPPFIRGLRSTGRIDDLSEQSLQWDYIEEVRSVDHLHCSFLYRAGIEDYNLGLSRVAFREETLFTYGLKQRGLKILAIPDTVTWHLKNSSGGVRTQPKEMFDNDDRIFQSWLARRDKTIVVLDSGMGDHLVFNRILPELENPEIYSCYPEITPGKSIAEAQWLFGDISTFNIYKKMHQWKWHDSLESAYRRLYKERLW